MKRAPSPLTRRTIHERKGIGDTFDCPRVFDGAFRAALRVVKVDQTDKSAMMNENCD
jgi:hypothetical protein